MAIYFHYNDIVLNRGTAVTLGNFDGFHRGHQVIVDKTVGHARAANLCALAITFHPHPRQLFGTELSLLTPIHDKVALLLGAGLDAVLVQPFTREFAALAPGQFLREVLRERLDCRHIVVGYDYCFGKGGTGTIAFLREEAARLGIAVAVVPPVCLDGQVVSSTAIRNLLDSGQVSTAADYMGRPYTIAGKVEHGAGRGKGLGFPTANIYPHRHTALPSFGVYLVEAEAAGTRYAGVANVGRHPTFADDRLSVEIYLLEFSGNLYGQNLKVSFFRKLRDEKRFATASQLAAQIRNDIHRAKALLKNANVLKLQRV